MDEVTSQAKSAPTRDGASRPAQQPRPDQPAPGEVEICAESLHKSFGEHHVLAGVDLNVRRGEIVAVVGSSGSGKTVLLHILVGLIPADSGRVLACNHALPDAPLIDLSEADDDTVNQIRLSWSVVFQGNALFSGTVRDNVALWLREHTGLNEQQIDGRVRRSLEAAALDVDDVIDKDREALSGGMAKRVAIARALAIEPLVVFYDEPTTGLDPVVSGHIHELIYNTHNQPIGTIATGGASESARASGQRRRTTIIVTHDRELLRRLRPRIVMLYNGGVCFDGPYEQFGRTDCAAAQEYLKEMPVLHGKHLA